jgi:uncharacterized protein YbjT (DUF2867 family)
MDNLLDAARREGVGHAVILSIVGAELVPDLVYYRAKVLQEDILKAGPVPYSIVRATQFFEFIDAVLSWTAEEATGSGSRADRPGPAQASPCAGPGFRDTTHRAARLFSRLIVCQRAGTPTLVSSRTPRPTGRRR